MRFHHRSLLIAVLFFTLWTNKIDISKKYILSQKGKTAMIMFFMPSKMPLLGSLPEGVVYRKKVHILINSCLSYCVQFFC